MPNSSKKAGSINLSGLSSGINKNSPIVGAQPQVSKGSGSGSGGNSRKNSGKINKKYDFGKRFGGGDIDDLKAQGYSRKAIKKFAKKHVDIVLFSGFQAPKAQS